MVRPVGQPWPSLESPRAKIDWAAKHFEVLYDKGRAWEEARPYRLRGHLDRDALEYVGGLTVEPRPKPELSLLLGDYVHNLRCALDHLVWQLVIANRQVPGKTNQFPIAITQTEWINRVDKGEWLRGAHPEAIAIIKSLQPCCGEGPPKKHLLAVLNTLDVSDKHHVVSSGALGIPVPDVEQGGPWGFTVLNGSATLVGFSLELPLPVIEDDADFMKLRFESMSPDFEMEMKDDLKGVELRMGESGELQQFSGSLNELAQMGYAVQYIVDKFDPSPPPRGVEFTDWE